MKQKMKRLVSMVAMLVMLVSMFSVYAVSASAAEATDYENLLKSAFVVNPAWENYEKGDPITFVFNGAAKEAKFDSNFHFATFEEAWAKAQSLRIAQPTILLCAGNYTDEIELTGGVTLLGPNAGIDPNVKSNSSNTPWTKAVRAPEAVIKADIYVDKSAADGDITIDGLAFGEGGAFVDYERASGASEITVKNTVFENAGNQVEARGYVFFMRNSGHSRIMTLENLYITGTNLNKPNANGTTVGFLGMFYDELYAKNIAYIDNANGFVAKSWFGSDVSPIIEISDSCFYNSEDVSANGYAISFDNALYGVNYAAPTTQGNHAVVDQELTSSSSRPRSSVKINNNIFYNASASEGVLHVQMVGLNNYVELKNNDFISTQDVITFMDTEFMLDSKGADQTSCFMIRNNRFINTYMIPNLDGSNDNTYMDLSYNYFGTSDGRVAYKPVYVNPEFPRLLRTAYWVDEEMTVLNTPWEIELGGSWDFVDLDNTNYTSNVTAFTQGNQKKLDVQYISPSKYTVQLYKNATFDANGLILDVSDPISGISLDVLNEDVYATTTLYVKVTNKKYPDFTPVYTVNVINSGHIDSKPAFSDVFPADHALYNPDVASLKKGSLYPYRWQGEIYKFYVGKDIFATVEDALAALNAKGYESPTILLPAGVYTEPLTISGSCTLLGEQYGVNPNAKPFEAIPQADFTRSMWTLNGARANDTYETIFEAPIAVADDADDYVITIDGIKMIKGSAVYDQGARESNNVLIMKNVHFDGAGHSVYKGTSNTKLFSFAKPSAADTFCFYLYDCRLENIVDTSIFSASIEKLVIDGTYIGDVTGQSYLFQGFTGRATVDNSLSLTNSYLYNLDTCRNAAGSVYYIWNFANSNTTNKVTYNFDGNVFYNVYPYGYSGMEVRFTGSNMRFYYTNNTVFSKDNKDQLFAVGSNRFAGTCAKEDLSNMIIMKGNRLIGMNRMFSTVDSGPGTMYDFSGNYIAATLTSAALTPENGALRFQSTTLGATGYRIKMDYTFLDWDMTIRSDAAAADTGLEYTITGPGKVTNELEGGKNIIVYRDSVPSHQMTYDLPVTLGEYSTYRIYTTADLSGAPAIEMSLDQAENIFYLLLSNKDGSETETIKVVINRPLNSEAKVHNFDGFIIDESKKEITGYISTPLYAYRLSRITASVGAVLGLYEDKACKTDAAYTIIAQSGKTVTRYLKVVSEDGSKTNIYKINLLYVKSTDIAPVAAVSAVKGMTYAGSNVYQTSVSMQQAEVTFTPDPLPGYAVKVYSGNTLLTPADDGSYTVANNSSGTQTYKMVVSNGTKSANYTLKINKALGSDSELFGITGGLKTDAGYVVNINMTQIASIDAQVSAGATYALYSDFMCTKPLANNQVNMGNESCIFAYLKVTSEDGTSSSVYKLTVMSQATNVDHPTITATANKKTYSAVMTGENAYTITLPAGVKSVNLKGSYELLGKNGALTFYADPEKTIMIGTDAAINLSQKNTKVYAVVATGIYNTYLPESFDYINGSASISTLDEDGNPTPVTVTVPDTAYSITIVSDRSVVTYKDDAKIASWAKPYVDYLNDNKFGIFQGDQNHNFNASNKITRYEIATVATLVMGLDVSKYSNVHLDFDDNITAWALPYVRAAVGAGIMKGALNVATNVLTFEGNRNATRAEVVNVFVAVALRLDGITIAPADYYALYKNDIDLNYYRSFNFKDDAKVPGWSKPYMHLAVSKYHLINGAADGSGNLYLNPTNTITRAEVAVIVANFLGA